MTSITKEAVADLGIKPRDAERSKNFFALGLLSWMYTCPAEPTLEWIRAKFAGEDQIIEANTTAFKAGTPSARRPSSSSTPTRSSPAEHEPGTYTNITGNTALSWGLVAASQLAESPLFPGSHPITPAPDIIHELSRRKNFGVRTLQAED